MSTKFDWAQGDPDYPEALATDAAVLEATEAIAEALERKGLTQAQLAKLCKISPGAISQRLRGTANMTIRNLGQMLFHLGYELQIGLVDAETGEEIIPGKPDPKPRTQSFSEEIFGVESFGDLTTLGKPANRERELTYV